MRLVKSEPTVSVSASIQTVALHFDNIEAIVDASFKKRPNKPLVAALE
ncbi:MAG: hypothetical protein H6714_06850 [Myxococcales bacterium]|nr:hypothetical protein [Myxococcales bacterium]